MRAMIPTQPNRSETRSVASAFPPEPHMLGTLLASMLVLLPQQAGDLPARLDETLDRLEQSHGADTWDLAHALRDMAESDSAQSAPYLIAAASERSKGVQVVIASTLVELDASADAANLLLPL